MSSGCVWRSRAPMKSLSTGPSATTASPGTAASTFSSSMPTSTACRRGEQLARLDVAHGPRRVRSHRPGTRARRHDFRMRIRSCLRHGRSLVRDARRAHSRTRRPRRTAGGHPARRHRAEARSATAHLSRDARRTDRPSQPHQPALGARARARSGQGRSAQLRLSRRLDRPSRHDQRSLRLRRRRRSDSWPSANASRACCAIATSSAAPRATSSASSWRIARNARSRSWPTACVRWCAAK